MGNRPSNKYRIRKGDRQYETPPIYNQPQQPVPNLNAYPQRPIPYQPPYQPVVYDTYHHDDEYVDVVGSDSGNMTVFSWVTQIGTCCASTCTLIVLVAFVIWMFLNRNINTLP